MGSFLSSVTYNGIGQLTGTTLGNGVTETYAYEPNRLQLTTQTATKSGGPTNGLMNLTYNYPAAAGQMGAGTTAGNAGQLMSISGTINSTSESAAYTYDNLGRLVTSNQTSNSSSAQRRFAYDRWGNRTGVWDATSGGTQIQSITLQGSGGIPTNQIASVTAGSTVNYTYDAAGNVTNDGAHSYGYDSENRIVSVDGGSTASYAYDHQNRRYKTIVGSTVTHYVWQGNQVLAEHNGSTGAVLTDYIYSNRRMIANVSSGTTRYFLSDRLSERLVLDSSASVVGRMAHLPFGEDFAESGTQEKHHFTSYERDGGTGTDYAVNRQLNQAVGRFMRADPIDGCIKSPQTLNRYSYVQNDPVNRSDPNGLEDAGKIPIEDEHLYECSGVFDSCKSMGEKIRDLTIGVNIRFWQLRPDLEAGYPGHARVWARQKNILSDCLKKFNDKGCGPDDFPTDFDPKRAEKEVRRKAPRVTGPGDFIRRGGMVPIGIGLGPVAVFICTVCPSCCAAGIMPELPPVTAPVAEPVPVTGISIGSGGWYADDPSLCDECPECCEGDPDPMWET